MLDFIVGVVGTVVIVTLGTVVASWLLAPKHVPRVEVPMSESRQRVHDDIIARVLAERALREASRTSQTG